MPHGVLHLLDRLIDSHFAVDVILAGVRGSHDGGRFLRVLADIIRDDANRGGAIHIILSAQDAKADDEDGVDALLALGLPLYP